MLQLTSPRWTDRPVENGRQQGEPTVLAPPPLLQYWQIVLRWKWIILGIIATAFTVGLIVTLLTSPQYSATSRIEISREQKKFTNVEGVDSPISDRDLEFYQTQYSLLQARSLAERVARTLRLSSSEEFFAAHGVDLLGSLFSSGTAQKSGAAETTRREKIAVDLLLDHIAVSPVRGSSLVDIRYVSGSPTISAQIANSWTQQFVAQSIDRRFASTTDARQFLEGRLADLRVKLETSERDLVNYAAQKGIVALGRTKDADGRTQVDRTLVSSDLEALNAALVTATAERIAAESRTQQQSAGANAEALSNPTINDLRQKRTEIASEYAKLMVRFEPDYPSAKELAQQLRTIDAGIAREEGRVLNSRSSDYQSAVLRENELRRRVEQLKSGLSRQQQDSIQYNIYQREADTNRQLYDGLLQRYKEIGVAGVGANNIAIVDPARVPDSPSSPNFLINLALALVAGLGIAAVATFALNQIDEGLRDPTQVGRILQVPLLGSVPTSEGSDTLTELQDTKSALSEAYLSIRSNLAFSTDHGIPRALMVTSTRASEGKSTTSFALAMVLGRTGKRVLLLDADMRSPSMHSFAGLPNVAGLSNYLAGADNWQETLLDTPSRGVTLMPSGPTPPSAAELLSSDRITSLIRQASEQFDHIVIDSPPILGLADAPLLTRAVEGIVFVVEADGVPIRGIKTSLARLQAVHAHVFGVVLTKLPSRLSSYGYGYGYSYGYGSNDSAA
ncbi:polysaccharide biosynthesis tyrosine autokinase [Sphingomonas sp. CFBP 8764]|nr:polysaccharide biosynthesis tyrosine autokinase [Sphingomonas sp. CFBP 8764]MBD8552708.1 polysaccharide biosynthesis tyrosine autokinase [Sphingomonas sp. CFBP 8764]